MSVSSGPNIPKGGLILSYDISDTVKSFKGAPTTNLTPDLGIGAVQAAPTLAYVGVEDGWKKYSLNGTWAAGTYPYSIAIDAITCTGGVTYSAGVYIKTNVPHKFASLFTGMNYVNQPQNLAGTSFSIPQADGSIYVGRYGFQYTGTSSQNGYILSQPLINQTFSSATDFVYIKQGQIEVGPVNTPFVSGTRSATQAVIDQTGNNTLTATGLTYEKISLAPSYSGSEKDFLTAELAQYGITVDEVAEQIWSNDGNAKVLTITKRITFFSGAIYYQAYNTTITLAADGTKWQPGGWVGSVRGLTLTKLESVNALAFTFNGSTSNFLFNDISLGNGNLPWTVSAWVKTTTAVNGTGLGAVISNWNSGPVYSSMGVNNGKIVYWTYQNAAWTQKLGVGKTVNDNTWHLLTWVNYNNFTMDMYVDGVLDSNVPNSTSGNNNPVNSVGRSWAGFFPGSITAVSIYNRSLSAAEVAQNFNATRNRYGV